MTPTWHIHGGTFFYLLIFVALSLTRFIVHPCSMNCVVHTQPILCLRHPPAFPTLWPPYSFWCLPFTPSSIPCLLTLRDKDLVAVKTLWLEKHRLLWPKKPKLMNPICLQRFKLNLTWLRSMLYFFGTSSWTRQLTRILVHGFLSQGYPILKNCWHLLAP